MPEGHTIHRAARDHRKIFANQILNVSSPQGRFADGANILNKNLCSDVEAFGKHLLYHFKNGQTLHVHLGLFGRINKHKLPLKEPKGAVRVRLVGQTHAVDINGPTICKLLKTPDALLLMKKIGPDLLRPDAKSELAFKKIAASRTPIGRLIMDQSVMAGVGNIYRSEILWRQKIHPQTPGKEISQTTFNRLWADAKYLLELGVKHNAIITIDKEKPSKTKYRERVNIFGKDKCPKCKSEISRITISSRRAFVCETCQIPPSIDCSMLAKSKLKTR